MPKTVQAALSTSNANRLESILGGQGCESISRTSAIQPGAVSAVAAGVLAGGPVSCGAPVEMITPRLMGRAEVALCIVFADVADELAYRHERRAFD